MFLSLMHIYLSDEEVSSGPLSSEEFRPFLISRTPVFQRQLEQVF